MSAVTFLDYELKKIKKRKKIGDSSKKNAPSTSTSKESYNPNIPDRSYGDLYCKICDSHMNSEGMWEAHIVGKRHIKNVNKGDKDTKYEDLQEECKASAELRKIAEPVVGLSYVHEIRRRGPDVPPYYNCFLCSSISFSIKLLIEHVISSKHRLNYMKEQCTEEYELIEKTNLKKGHMEPLIFEKAIEMEKQYGRGKIVVKQEKPKINIPVSKRYRSSSEESEDYQRPSKNFRSDKNGFWKSVSSSKICDEKTERSYKDRKGEFRDSDVKIVRDSYTMRHVPMRREISADRKESYPRSRSTRREISPDQNDSFPRPYETTLSTDNYPRGSEYDKYSHHTDLDSIKQARTLTEEHSQDRPQHETNLKKFVEEAFQMPFDFIMKITIARMDPKEFENGNSLSVLAKLLKKSYQIIAEKIPHFASHFQSSQQLHMNSSNIAGSTVTAPESNVSASGDSSFYRIPTEIPSSSVSTPAQPHEHFISFQNSSNSQLPGLTLASLNPAAYNNYESYYPSSASNHFK